MTVARLPDVVRGEAAIASLVAEWRALVVETGAPVFTSPDWLLSWRRRYVASGDAFVLAWRDGTRLSGILPLVRRSRRLPPYRELAPWAGDGTSLRGMVDLVARPADLEAHTAGFGAWLTAEAWDVVSVLRLPPGSPTGDMLAGLARERGWRLVSNTGLVRSDAYVLDLPKSGDPDGHALGPKARHNLRTEARRFERQGGRYETVTDAAGVPEVVAAIRQLSEARWGEAERTFRGDPAAEPFLVDVLGSMAAQGSLVVSVARDDAGIRAALVTLVVGRRAVAVVIGVSGSADVRPLSLGKQLFAASIDAAIERGADTYDFLWAGGYKEAFWGATPRRLESLVVGRGLVGTLVLLRARARRGSASRDGDGPRGREAAPPDDTAAGVDG